MPAQPRPGPTSNTPCSRSPPWQFAQPGRPKPHCRSPQRATPGTSPGQRSGFRSRRPIRLAPNKPFRLAARCRCASRKPKAQANRLAPEPPRRPPRRTSRGRSPPARLPLPRARSPSPCLRLRPRATHRQRRHPRHSPSSRSVLLSRSLARFRIKNKSRPPGKPHGPPPAAGCPLRRAAVCFTIHPCSKLFPPLAAVDPAKPPLAPPHSPRRH